MEATPADAVPARAVGGPLIRVSSVAKAFGPTQALRDGSFELRVGEVHALVGENGSGKSTLVKILSGVHAPDTGELVLDGEVTPFPGTPRAAQRAGIVTVFQEVLVAEARSVLDNVWLGVDTPLHTFVPTAEKRRRAAEVLERLLERPPDLDVAVEDLSLSDRQACCIARALMRDPRVLILDEATSALDVATRDRLFEIVTELSATGLGVIFITHRMDEVAELGDRVTVLRSGATVGELRRGEWTSEELVRLMTGADHLTAGARAQAPAAPERIEEPVLIARGLQLRQGLEPFDVTIRAGELVGVAGLEGHGQREFLDALRGVGAVAGEVVRQKDGQEVVVRTTAGAAKQGIAYVPRERGQALFRWMSIRENFGMPTLDQDQRSGWLRPRSTRERLGRYVDDLSVRLGDAEDEITTLSGGNQQKVVIARWLAAEPRVLVLNDPTRGIDIGAKKDLYRLLADLAGQGLAVVMVSSEIDEHVELMDRVLVFREHGLFAELDRTELTRTALVSAFFGYGPGDSEAAGDTRVASVPAEAAPAPGGLRGVAASARSILRGHSFVFAALLTAILLIVSLIRTPDFGWSDQLANFAPLALAAMASTPAIISGGGGFDLSISPLMIFTSAAFIVWLVPAGMGGPESVPILLAMGAAVGAINGTMILLLRIPPVVVTLAMYFILIGLDLRIVPDPAYVTGSWTRDLAGSIGPIPGALFTIGAPLLIWLLLGRIPYRRILYLVGSSGPTAFSSGVNVGLVRVFAFTLGGMFAAIGGIAIVALTSSANANLASTYTLMAIAAVALGGTSLWGGRGGLVGPLLGAASIYLLGNELTSLQVNPSYLQVIYGLLLVVAVTLGGMASRSRGATA